MLQQDSCYSPGRTAIRQEMEVVRVDADMEGTTPAMTRRRYLGGGGNIKGKKLLDMEKIYRQIDGGRSVSEVAKEWGVSRTTLYRRHREYQKEVEAVLGKAQEPAGKLQEYALPPLPEDIV